MLGSDPHRNNVIEGAVVVVPIPAYEANRVIATKRKHRGPLVTSRMACRPIPPRLVRFGSLLGERRGEGGWIGAERAESDGLYSLNVASQDAADRDGFHASTLTGRARSLGECYGMTS